jgi:uroporphyrinogen decarboxylase
MRILREEPMKRLLRKPDFENFLKVVRRQGKPSHLPFYEHIANPKFIAARTETDYASMEWGSDEQVAVYVDFWLGLGFDCIPLEQPLRLRGPEPVRGGAPQSHGSESAVVIRNREDFERYPWPSVEDPLDFSIFEKVARLLPDGVKIVGGVCKGPYEIASDMLGTVGMSYLLADDPDLVAEVFARLSALYLSANRTLATMDGIGAHRQGDDLGFNSSTFLPPELLRRFIFPVYKEMAAIAHRAGRPFVLHSCGNLADVYEDLIACGIDAKHSFEDKILPVAEFKKIYGSRITPLGGLDVDFICRRSKEEIRRYTLDHIEECFADGYWTLGTGNSLTDYMPVENYVTVLETALEAAG